jgi:hypothetical protein
MTVRPHHVKEQLLVGPSRARRPPPELPGARRIHQPAQIRGTRSYPSPILRAVHAMIPGRHIHLRSQHDTRQTQSVDAELFAVCARTPSRPRCRATGTVGQRISRASTPRKPQPDHPRSKCVLAAIGLTGEQAGWLPDRGGPRTTSERAPQRTLHRRPTSGAPRWGRRRRGLSGRTSSLTLVW